MKPLDSDERTAVRKISHDLNNIVTVITGLCDLILVDHAGEDELCEDVQEIREKAEQVGQLSDRLRAVLGDPQANPWG